MDKGHMAAVIHPAAIGATTDSITVSDPPSPMAQQPLAAQPSVMPQDDITPILRTHRRIHPSTTIRGIRAAAPAPGIRAAVRRIPAVARGIRVAVPALTTLAGARRIGAAVAAIVRRAAAGVHRTGKTGFTRANRSETLMTRTRTDIGHTRQWADARFPDL